MYIVDIKYKSVLILWKPYCTADIHMYIADIKYKSVSILWRP